MIRRSRIHLSEVTEDKPYIKTNAQSEALWLLQRSGHLIIIGKPGSGKSTLSLRLMKEITEGMYGANKRPLFVDSRLLSQLKIDATDNLAIFADDSFGKYDLAIRKAREWVEISEFLCAITSPLSVTGGNCLVINMRKDVFLASHDIIEESAISTFPVFDLDTVSLTNEEKIQLFRTYNENVDESDVARIILTKDSAPVGFPQCCRVYSEARKDGHVSWDEVFTNPILPLITELQKMKIKSPLNFAVLTLVFMVGGNCPVVRFRTDDIMCKEVIEFCCGTNVDVSHQALMKAETFCTEFYLYHEENVLTFSHDSVHDAVAKALWNENALFVLERCSLSFIRRISIDNDDVFALKSDLRKQLMKRVIEVLLKGDDEDLETLSYSKFLDDENFLTDFVTNIVHKNVSADIVKRFVQFTLREKKDFVVLHLLKEFPMLLDKKDLLIHACRYGCLDVYYCLKNLGVLCDIDTLFHALKGGNDGIFLNIILTNDISTTETRVSKQRPALQTNIFQELALSGNISLMKQILTNQNCLSASFIEENHLIHFAVMGRSLKTVEFCLTFDIDLNRRFGEYGESVLHKACSEGLIEIVQNLLEKNRDLIHSRDNEDYTPLFSAIIGGYIDVVQYLLKNGADAMTLGRNGRTILHLACWKARENIALYLMDTYPSLMHIPNANGMPTLHYGGFGGSITIFNQLVERGLDINVKDPAYFNVLHKTCLEGGNEDMIKYLVENFSHLLHEHTIDGRSVLHCAVSQGSLSLLKYFIYNKHLDVHAKSHRGRNILHEALVSSSVTFQIEKVKFLLKRFPFLNGKDNEGKSLIHFAAWGGDLQVFQYIEGLRFNVMEKDSKGNNVLHFAIMSESKHSIQLTRYLVDKYPSLLHQSGNQGMLALHYAACQDNVDVYEFVAEYYEDHDVRDGVGTVVLLRAFLDGKLKMAKYLARRYPHQIDLTDNEKLSVLHFAAMSNNLQVLKFALDIHPDVSVVDFNDLTFPERCLYKVCTRNQEPDKLELILFCIDNYPQLFRKNTTLCAAVSCSVKIFEHVNNSGLQSLDVYARNNSCNMLQLVCHKATHKEELVLKMIEHLEEKYPDLVHMPGWRGISTLFYAAMGGFVSVFEHIKEKGFDVYETDYRGWSIMYYVCMEQNKKNNTKLALHLTTIYPQLLKCDLPFTPLHEAAEQSCLDLFKVLEPYFDVFAGDESGQTVLHKASQKRNDKIVEYLLQKYRTLVSYSDNKGRTALHLAVDNKPSDKVTVIVKMLIQSGSDITSRNNTGKTVKMIAKSKNNSKVLEVLAEIGAPDIYP